MPLVNFTAREITCKLVYCGPGRSGKTTNLQYVHGRVPAHWRGDMVSLATHGDRTLFFDFLPLDLGTISGFSTRFQLYTVPGQVYYAPHGGWCSRAPMEWSSWRTARPGRFDEKFESLQDLQDALLDQGIDVRTFPMVFQYNNRISLLELILPRLDGAGRRAVAQRRPGVRQPRGDVSQLPDTKCGSSSNCYAFQAPPRWRA